LHLLFREPLVIRLIPECGKLRGKAVDVLYSGFLVNVVEPRHIVFNSRIWQRMIPERVPALRPLKGDAEQLLFREPVNEAYSRVYFLIIVWAG
jgi:hypothetical protein